MRLRQLVLACGLASLALSSQVSALGLGEVRLKSTLNQPLEAEVKLLDTRDLTAEQILVSLASPADFERNGVDRLYFYTEFQFTVDLESPDGPKVLITSRNPVREPYLNFLIEARWTAGRLLREYTLLMDLPTFDEDAATRPVQTATTSATGQARQTTAPAPSASAPRATRASAGSTGGGAKPRLNGNEYEVRNNDTLWEIALRARPDSSVSVHQSMMALYQANPDAFIGGNINRLRRGQVLRIPDASEMKSVTKAEALNQFTAASSGDSTLGAQINASRRASGTRAESTEVSGRVRLAAPSATDASGQGSGANDGSGKALESELAATLEELDKSKAENTELSSRVRDLEAQIETMQRLVDVSNEKLRALQVAAEQQNANAGSQSVGEQPVTQTQPLDQPALTPESVAPVEETAPAIVESTPAPQEQVVAHAPEPVSSAAASSAPVVAPSPSNTVVSRPQPQPTLVDKAIENAPWIGLLVLALAGAGYFVYRRRQQQAEEAQALEQENVFAFDDEPAPSDEPEEAPEFDGISENESLFEEEQIESSAVAETGDVVGEADIYIAYGNLDQAEEILLNALKKDPDSSEIRMKLLEIYSLQQNLPKFDQQYSALLPIAGAALVARASELRANIPGAGEFYTGVAETQDSPEEYSLGDLDLDDDSGVADGAPVATNYEASDFDFALDLDDEELPADSVDVASKAADDEFSFDLEDELEAKSETDLSELSLALDDLEEEELPADVEVSSAALEDEFNFDLDDDLELDSDLSAGNLEAGLTESSTNLANNDTESLDVTADDFNLDMDVGGVDLAALDHEMESLDEEDIDVDTASISEFAAQEIAKDEEEVGLDLDDEMHLEEIEPSSLNLTDALDNPDEDLEFSLEDEKALDAELEADFAQLETGAEDLEFDLDSELEKADEVVVDTGAGYAEPSAAESDAQDEDLFSQALSEFSPSSDDLDLNEFSSDESALADLSDEEMDSELDFLADADEAATKLDLARAYIDMGDIEGAKDILSEVVNEGNDDQRKEANELLGRIV